MTRNNLFVLEQILLMDSYFQHLLNIIKTPNDLQIPVKKATDH